MNSIKKLKLEDIAEKDLRKYLKSNSIGFYSARESVCGKVRWFKWDKGECSVFSNFYPCRIEYDGMIFNSSEQMFTYYVYADRPDVQSRIMRARDAKEVHWIAKEYDAKRNLSIKDWVSIMKVCQEYKYLCCPEFRERVILSGDLPLVEANDWWDVKAGAIDGSKLKNGMFKGEDVSDYYIGLNALGRCIMWVREKYKNVFKIDWYGGCAL